MDNQHNRRTQAAAIRRAARIRALRATLSAVEIARRLRISRQRVYQILGRVK